ncbi:MAG: hypothetical protein WBG89_04050 [Ornithinimicrobium sp.]
MAIDVGAVKLDSPYLVRDVGVRLSTAAGEVASRAGDIRSSWAGLASLYEAPEQSLVLAAMDVPDTEAGEFSEKSLRVQGALSTYADALEGLQARKATLMADVEQFYAEKAQVEADNADNAWYETGWDWATGEDNDLLEREEGLLARVGELQAEKDAAERACANTIGAIWGAADYSAADETTVWDENVYGMSEEGYEQAALSGDTPWGHPDMWSDGDWTTKVFMLERGAERSITGLFEFGGDLVGVDGGGQAKAAWSGLAQLGGDLAMTSSIAAPFTSAEQKAESGERLLGVGKAMIGWDTWGTSGWNTAGGLGFDVALTAATLGYGGAAKGGARAATATSGVRRVVGPLSASRAGQMASALRVNLSSRASTALNTLRHLPDDTARSFSRFLDHGEPALAGAPGRHLDDFVNRMDASDRPGVGTPDRGGPGSPGTSLPSRWDDPARREAWVDDLRSSEVDTRPADRSGPEYDYQREQLGDTEYRLYGNDGSNVWADSVTLDKDGVAAADAKYVVRPGDRALYEGGRPEFLYRQFDGEMMKYKAALQNPESPVSRLRLITNTPKAAEFLESRARSILGPDIDLKVVVRNGSG